MPGVCVFLAKFEAKPATALFSMGRFTRAENFEQMFVFNGSFLGAGLVVDCHAIPCRPLSVLNDPVLGPLRFPGEGHVSTKRGWEFGGNCESPADNH